MFALNLLVHAKLYFVTILHLHMSRCEFGHYGRFALACPGLSCLSLRLLVNAPLEARAATIGLACRQTVCETSFAVHTFRCAPPTSGKKCPPQFANISNVELVRPHTGFDSLVDCVKMFDA